MITLILSNRINTGLVFRYSVTPLLFRNKVRCPKRSLCGAVSPAQYLFLNTTHPFASPLLYEVNWKSSCYRRRRLF